MRIVISTKEREKFCHMLETLLPPHDKKVHLSKDFASYRIPGFEFVVLGEVDLDTMRATQSAADEIVLLDITSIDEETVCTCQR